jgi:hypothetical protein
MDVEFLGALKDFDVVYSGRLTRLLLLSPFQIVSCLISSREFFFTFFPSQFFKKYGPNKILQSYTSDAVGDGGTDLPPCPMAVGRREVL